MLYDQKGIATAIINFEYDYSNYALVSDLTYQDIVWEECGQIMSSDYLCLNDVRAKSYNITKDGVPLASTSITYNTDGLFSCSKVTKDAKSDYTETYSFKSLDNHGSYEEAISGTEDGVTNGQKLIELYNEYGDQTEITSYEIVDGNDEIYDKITLDHTYVDGKCMETIISMINPDTEEFGPSEKHVYSNHIQIAGIENVVIDNNAPIEYYNLQGTRIDNPSNGIFIRRQGNSVSKVLIK